MTHPMHKTIGYMTIDNIMKSKEGGGAHEKVNTNQD